MSAHTPGPWRTKTTGASDAVTVIKGADNTIVADVFGYDRSDAALIAAAPELLEALRDLLEMYTNLVECGDCGYWDAEKEREVIAARAAIAKATGAK